MKARTAIAIAAALGLLATSGAAPAELLYVSEGNRLHRLDLASVDAPPLRREVLIPSAADDPIAGLDINGMICAVEGSEGHFIASEDTGQPRLPGGWALFSATGERLGKLVASASSELTEPHGCAFDAEGRLFTTEIGDPGFLPSNGQLIVWFPPFDVFPGGAGIDPSEALSENSCKLATDLGTAGGVALDRAGRVYVASSNRGAIHRFSPPFPTGPDAEGGCGSRDALGSPLAEAPEREVFVRAPATFSGLALSPAGTLFAASVLTGEIFEYDLEGRRLRHVLQSESWLPPHTYGTPQGLAVDSDGNLYYADLDLVREGWFGIEPGPNGKVWRIRFDESGEPGTPELLMEGLAFPDGLGVLPGSLATP